MEKSIHTNEHAIFVALLREARETAGLTQVDLADRIGESQVFVSRYERGETRLDIIQLRTICRELGTTLRRFCSRLEAKLGKG